MTMDGSAWVVFFGKGERDHYSKVRTLSNIINYVSGDVPTDTDSLTDISIVDSEKNPKSSVYIDDVELWITIDSEKDEAIPNSILSFSVRDIYLESQDDNEVPDFRTIYFDLVKRLAVELNASFVTSYNSKHVQGGPAPKLVLPSKEQIDLKRIPWLGVYGQPLIEKFGGRERVLNTPAWHVEELDNGSILIITTKEPWEGYERKQPVDRYLLDGDDSASL